MDHDRTLLGNSPLVIQPHHSPLDDIGPLLRSLEATADELEQLSPPRLTGDADRIMSAAMRLVRLASAVRLAKRKHGEAA